MNRKELKKAIVDLVTEVQGCKLTEVPVILFKIADEAVHSPFFRELPKLIRELIEEKKLVEVEYVLPAMSYRAKTFLLPAGTEITIQPILPILPLSTIPDDHKVDVVIRVRLSEIIDGNIESLNDIVDELILGKNRKELLANIHYQTVGGITDDDGYGDVLIRVRANIENIDP